jgi:hypothetical protein
MKEKVTTTIDPELKEMFEKTKSIHNRTLEELLELGIRKVLIGLNDTALIEQEQNRLDLELLSLSQERETLLKLREDITNFRT